MTVTTGGLGSPALSSASAVPCRSCSIWFSLRTFGVTQLLDHQHRRVLIDRLVDGGHHAHVHQDLDDLVRLDGHLLSQLGNRGGLADPHFAHDRRRRHLKAMLALRPGGDRPRFRPALLLVARADVARDMQLLAAVARGLVVLRRSWGRRLTLWRTFRSTFRLTLRWGSLRPLPRGSSRGRRRCRSGSSGGRTFCLRFGRTAGLFFPLSLARLGFFARTLLRGPARIFLRLLACLLFFDTTPVLSFQTLTLAALSLDTLRLALHGLFGLATLLIDLVLLLASLLLEHVALDVGAFAAHFHVDGAGPALGAGEL